MKERQFGNTDLTVSEVGFGAWGIGGPAMAGDVPIGWGNVDDSISVKSLKTAVDRGMNFIDTADFYGLGHSEKLIGSTFGNSGEVIIATKVGHRLAKDKSIFLDYSKEHILQACDNSLKRLDREVIDYYQLHSAKLEHLENGECIEAMEELKEKGKIRYWGISLSTYNPFPEAEFMIKNKLGSGFQLVFNVINQRALSLLDTASNNGFGIIARMPLQFGLLTGKFDANKKFQENDHRQFRLKPEVLERAIDDLAEVWELCDNYEISKTALSLSFILSFPQISTVIPGIKTPAQAIINSTDLIKLYKDDKDFLIELYETKLKHLLEFIEENEG
ncbi:MAG: aldo/keto reductase [Ignavibacteriae bacterium]|nr:aldo/keto reductase [Ignavibacteriota bacterium]NOG98074.1 aldo/keto reductase [Ignavibacteriota bacterium]